MFFFFGLISLTDEWMDGWILLITIGGYGWMNGFKRWVMREIINVHT